MPISPVSAFGAGAAALTAGLSGKDTATELRNKIDTLEKQKKQIEESAPQKKNDAESLDRRIQNLQKRLDKLENKSGDGECKTCENRKYQDGSDDPGVSFKSATKIAPGAVTAAVRGHEMEHVYRNQAKAEREGREVISQSVRIKTAICPECGKSYTAGGETRTVTRAKSDDRFSVGMEDGSSKGSVFDKSA